MRCDPGTQRPQVPGQVRVAPLDVADALQAYQQDQVAFYGNYAEFAQAQSNVENAVIAFKDNRVVMAIASNECTADLDSAVDSALNS